MTTEVVKLLARYNRTVNTEMNGLLSTLAPEEWNRGFGGYYPSLRSLCSHVFISDANWLVRFKSLRRFEVLETPLRYSNWKNEPQDRNVGVLAVHIFNHQTHHRGMISLYLELLGRANDFSNLLKLG